MESVIPCCSICLVSLGALDGTSRLRNCGHAYHHDCITSWLSKHNLCPDCRKTANPDDVMKDFVLEAIIESMKKLNVVFGDAEPVAPRSTTNQLTSTNNNNNNINNPNMCPAYHAHQLNQTDSRVIYPPTGKWFCDICSASPPVGAPMHHCAQCANFDMCGACFEKGRTCAIENTAKHIHPVIKSDPLSVYPQFRGKWHCNLCRRNNQTTMYHCYYCTDFDMCEFCI